MGVKIPFNIWDNYLWVEKKEGLTHISSMMAKRTQCLVKETTPHPPARVCDQEGCQEEGCYRAPKNQNLCEYYLFCLTHVRHYNATWNYYRGMSPEQFEKSRHEDLTWHRPTWPFGKESPLKKSWDFRESPFFKAPPSANVSLPTAVQQALKVFNLDLPLTASTLKKRYNELVKKYHPDAQTSNKQGEEKLKVINQAYGELKKFLKTFINQKPLNKAQKFP